MEVRAEATAQIRVGTAGWNVPEALRDRFGAEGSHLERYASRLDCVEINSSFYRDHRAETYERWAASVPPDFLFSVKLSKTLTHEKRLAVAAGELEAKIEPIFHLGPKLGCLLVQLPPSLAFFPEVAPRFFARLRRIFAGMVAVEPRHPSWRAPAATELARERELLWVRADPAPIPPALEEGSGRYLRLHGSPQIYKSDYEPRRIQRIASELHSRGESGGRWCIFDNTTFGYAARNALELKEALQKMAGLGEAPGPGREAG